MGGTISEQTDALRFFRGLADPSRLGLLGILAVRNANVEELAGSLGLDEPVVLRHLGYLRGQGLLTIRTEETSPRYRLDMDALRALGRALQPSDEVPPPAVDGNTTEWERQIVGNFFRGERLTKIPAGHEKRRAILRWLAGRFEPGVDYPERQVNETLGRHHPDFAALRRYLVDEGLMTRAASVYRRA